MVATFDVWFRVFHPDGSSERVGQLWQGDELIITWIRRKPGRSMEVVLGGRHSCPIHGIVCPDGPLLKPTSDP